MVQKTYSFEYDTFLYEFLSLTGKQISWKFTVHLEAISGGKKRYLQMWKYIYFQMEEENQQKKWITVGNLLFKN